MKHYSKKQKVAVAIGAGAIAVAGAGSAIAFWSSTGSGTGSATTTAGNSNLSIVQTSTITDLAPGVAADTISGTVTNNAANSAYVHQVTVSISSVTPGTGTCDATDYTLTGAAMTVDQDIAAAGSTPFTGATIAFNNKATNQDGCKNAVVHLAYASN